MKTKSVLLIGLGRFGKYIAMKLHELGHEIMAVDENEERINDAMPYVTNGQIGDSTNEALLKSLGVKNYDVCIVTIGISHLSRTFSPSMRKITTVSGTKVINATSFVMNILKIKHSTHSMNTTALNDFTRSSNRLASVSKTPIFRKPAITAIRQNKIASVRKSI